MEAILLMLFVYATTAIIFFGIYAAVGLSSRFMHIKLHNVFWALTCAFFWPIAIAIQAYDFTSQDHNFK